MDHFLFQLTGRLAAVVASSDEAIISKNLDGVITSWNDSAERMFRYAAEEAIGQHVTLIIPPERRFEEVDILARVRRGDLAPFQRHFWTAFLPG